MSFSQSRYPLQTVIEGDSVVILTKGQADTINTIFESQKKKLADIKTQLLIKDSLLKAKDSLLRVIYSRTSDYEQLKADYLSTLFFLDHVENWIYDRAVEGAWLYYSYDSNWIEAVDLSEYKVRKNDATGDIFFYRADTCPPEDKKKNDYPRRGWEKEVVLPHRPKINKL